MSDAASRFKEIDDYLANGYEPNNQILAALLLTEDAFINDWPIDIHGKKQHNIAAMICCNDVFWWATADAEPITCDELVPLYKLWREWGWHGLVKWVCLKRKMQPQIALVNEMKEHNHWDSELEVLDKPSPS